jgi:hypothetical protein
MEAICFSETSVDTQRTTQRHVPENGTLPKYRCENMNSYKLCQFVRNETVANWSNFKLMVGCF